jgi:ketosteroid isomerase-like protein
MTRDDVNRWLARYVEAWKTYEPDVIGDLFSEDASYRYHPWDEPLEGRAAIVADWLANRDEPGTYDAEYTAFAVDGDHAVATGTSRYSGAGGRKTYHNVYLLEFDGDGRCRAFTELFMEQR